LNQLSQIETAQAEAESELHTELVPADYIDDIAEDEEQAFEPVESAAQAEEQAELQTELAEISMLTSLEEEEQQPFEPVEPAAEAVAELQTELPEEFDADFAERRGATAF